MGRHFEVGEDQKWLRGSTNCKLDAWYRVQGLRSKPRCIISGWDLVMDVDNPREIRERGEDMVFRVCPPIERLLYRDIFDFFEMERIIDIYIYTYTYLGSIEIEGLESFRG